MSCEVDSECLGCLVVAHRLTGLGGALTALAIVRTVGIEAVRRGLCFLHRRVFEEMAAGVAGGGARRHDDPA